MRTVLFMVEATYDDSKTTPEAVAEAARNKINENRFCDIFDEVADPYFGEFQIVSGSDKPLTPA
jgi:hypothetical protein